jgi:hypothetical protein
MERSVGLELKSHTSNLISAMSWPRGWALSTTEQGTVYTVRYKILLVLLPLLNSLRLIAVR